MKEFIISDETVNSNGFSVWTAGIKLGRFLTNPVMYYNHQPESGVIGRWENLHIDGTRLFATPVFDMSDELGRKIAKKVEDGFIKAASIGITDIEGTFEEVSSCTLHECSICDIPSNPNTLALYHNNVIVSSYNEYIKLSGQGSLKPQQRGLSGVLVSGLSKIAEALGLPPDASEQDILNTISVLTQGDHSVKKVVDDALQMKLVSMDERNDLVMLGMSNPASLASYIRKLKEKQQSQFNLDYDEFVKIHANQSIPFSIFKNTEMKEFASKNFSKFKELVESAPKRIKIMDMIHPSSGKSIGRDGWTLKDYRKRDPDELRNNPDLYADLLKQDREMKNL